MNTNFITNTGLTQTIFHNNNQTHFNELTWDADYDGNIANISVMNNRDGRKENFDFRINNDDLAKLLNIPSVGLPLDKRLEMDFAAPVLKKTPKTSYYTRELPKSINSPDRKELHVQKSSHYLSSPLINEELIIPNVKKGKPIGKYTLMKKIKQKRQKPSHITYKVYKKKKSNSSVTTTPIKNKHRHSSKRYIKL